MVNASNGQIPLHKTLHFRRLRELFEALCNTEHIKAENYDFFNMHVYECYGSNLMGRTVTCEGLGSQGCSCWAPTEKYEIIEVPHKNNARNNPTGCFLFLAKNVSKGYWLFGGLDCDVDTKESKKKLALVEKSVYFPISTLDIQMDGKRFEFQILTNAARMKTYKNIQNYTYDFNSARKKSYGTDRIKLLEKICNTQLNTTNLIDKQAVKVYKKRFVKPKKNQEKN